MVLFRFIELLKGHIICIMFGLMALSYVPNVDCSLGDSTAVVKDVCS